MRRPIERVQALVRTVRRARLVLVLGGVVALLGAVGLAWIVIRRRRHRGDQAGAAREPGGEGAGGEGFEEAVAH